MKIHDKCLPCLVNQVVKVADLTGAENRTALYQSVFQYLSETDFSGTNPEIIGGMFRLLKTHIGNADPYMGIRDYYNKLFLGMETDFIKQIGSGKAAFANAVKYAILGNIIDFSPAHSHTLTEILAWFENAAQVDFTVNHVAQLKAEVLRSRRLLYLGDNCGEICLDKLLLREIKRVNPDIRIHFAVRGAPVVNDSVYEDAFTVGIDAYAEIISNGDDSLGTVLPRVSADFRKVYSEAELVISKGQANYESLSEQADKNIYYLLMAKCGVIAGELGVPEKAVVCMTMKDSRSII